MNETPNPAEKIHANVLFGEGTFIAVTGILGGVALALGFPWVILTHGTALGNTLLVLFVLAGLLIGGTVAIASAVLGLVMPRQVGGGAPGGISDWIRWGMECKKWSEKDWEDWADAADWSEPDYEHWSPQDWKAWASKMKEKYKGKAQ